MFWAASSEEMKFQSQVNDVNLSMLTSSSFSLLVSLWLTKAQMNYKLYPQPKVVVEVHIEVLIDNLRFYD